MRVLIYTMPDNSVKIGRIATAADVLSHGIREYIGSGMTEDEAISYTAEKDKPDGTMSWRVADSTELPSGQANGTYDRSFFGAMVDTGGSVEVDMPKARNIHMDNIRRARDAKLAELDIEQLKGNDVAAQKQALRDLPAKFDLSGAADATALKALWPSELADG